MWIDGVVSATSLRLLRLSFNRWTPVTTFAEIGTVCRFSLRRWAVTTMSRTRPDSSAEGGAGEFFCAAACGGAGGATCACAVLASAGSDTEQPPRMVMSRLRVGKAVCACIELSPRDAVAGVTFLWSHLCRLAVSLVSSRELRATLLFGLLLFSRDLLGSGSQVRGQESCQKGGWIFWERRLDRSRLRCIRLASA